MAKVVTPITATVEVIGKLKESTYSPGTFYHPVLFLDAAKQGEEAKIWKNLTDEEAAQIKKGDRVQLVPIGQDKSGKDKHQIVKFGGVEFPANPVPVPACPTPSQVNPQASPSDVGMAPDLKRAIAAYVEELGGLYAFCLDVSQKKIGASCDAETVRCMASSLFIASQRKFGL
jgi:hypothetical protein